jgi:hypothetical protein
MTEKYSSRAGPFVGHYRHLTGPAGVGLFVAVFYSNPNQQVSECINITKDLKDSICSKGYVLERLLSFLLITTAL